MNRLRRRRRAPSETPGAKIEEVKCDAKEIGGDESELSSTCADNADDGAVDGSNDPALPKLPADEDRREYRQDTRDVIQTNRVEQVCHFSCFPEPTPSERRLGPCCRLLILF